MLAGIRRILLSALVVLACAVSASAQWNSEWLAFRRAHPYHTQVIAVSKPNIEGRTLMILSEPPPGITADVIRGIAPELIGNVGVAEHRIGYDGWAKDALIELPPITETQLRELVEKVHVKFFGTAYKAVAVPTRTSIPAKRRSENFDLHVSSATINRWLIEDESQKKEPVGWLTIGILALLGLYGLKVFGENRKFRHGLVLVGAVGVSGYLYWTHRQTEPQTKVVRFTPMQGGAASTLNKILRSGAPGLYVSEKPGLVAWNIAKSDKLNSSTREIRQFALDSDIIIGAVGSNDRVAIIAREREISIDELPALRAETILQLAAVNQRELSQSYERTDFFSGRYDDHWDWAPIFLSGALIDTEYGSLLNITDQLLKSWSLNNMVSYVNFQYPAPSKFPFPRPLNVHANTSEVTFNWNTKGAGYTANFGEFEVYAANRTGALPVDYLGTKNARLRDAEDVAYDFFAQENDPNLVRVVQYAQLYQVFRNFGLSADMKFENDEQLSPPEFRESLTRVLEFLLEPDHRLLNRISEVVPEDAEALKKLAGELEGLVQEQGRDVFGLIADATMDPRTFPKRAQAIANAGGSLTVEQFRSIVAVSRQVLEYRGVLRHFTGLDLAQARQAYVQNVTRRTAGWIRTPSIVQSRTSGELARASGGHSLDSTVTSFRRSAGLAKGEVRVTEEGGRRVVLYNAEDEASVSGTVRAVARNPSASTAEIEADARVALSRAKIDARPLTDVLEISTKRAASYERGFQAGQVEASIEHTGWKFSSRVPNESETTLLKALESSDRHTIIIDKANDGFVIYDGASHRLTEAASQPSAIDALSAYISTTQGNRNVHLHLRGFNGSRQAQGFAKSADFQLAGFNGGRRTISATIEDAPMRPDALKAILTERYNFKQITIREISQPFRTTEGKLVVRVTAEIKMIGARFKATVVEFWIELKNGVVLTQELLGQIQARVMMVLRGEGVTISPEGNILHTKELFRDLKIAHPEVEDVRIRVKTEAGDVLIGLNRHNESAGECAGLAV